MKSGLDPALASAFDQLEQGLRELAVELLRREIARMRATPIAAAPPPRITPSRRRRSGTSR